MRKLHSAGLGIAAASVLALSVLLGQAAPAAAGAVLDRVAAAGTLRCSVLTEPDDYDKFDIHGALDALGDDMCKAVAAAVLGDAAKVTSVDLSSEARGFAALQAGKIDLLIGASPSASARSVHGLTFTTPVFLDGMGFLVRRGAGIASLADLNGKQVCYIDNSEADTAFQTFVQRSRIHALPFPFQEDGEMQAALLVGHCDSMLASVSRLAVGRAGFRAQIKNFVLLPQWVSVEPLAPAIQDGDPQWAAVVEAVVDALILAEEGGIGRADADKLRSTTDPQLRLIAGTLPGIDAGVIDRDWAIRAIKAVGNYGELYERDIGKASPLDIPRGPNALWSRGGLVHATPPR